MNTSEQIEFVKKLSENVVNEILNDIQGGRIPANWDGIELRQLLADRFASANFVKMGRGRKREYNNFCLVNNL